MIHPHFQLFCRTLTTNFGTVSLASIFLLLLSVSYGCDKKAQEQVQLEMKSVQPTGSNGIYKVAGSTNLPDSSQIAVAAVRFLVPTSGQQAGVLNDQANNNRSILARQIVGVKQGQWQADLNLWQVAADGRFQEVWQAYPQMKLRPDSNVTFIATFEPAGQLKKSNLQLEGKQLRFTNKGEIYLQARQTMPISLPLGKTTPPVTQAEDLNKNKANQSQIQAPILTSNTSFLRSAKFRQTNAPLKPSEFLR